MNQSKISVRYAKALFMLAKEKEVLDEVYLNMKVLENVIVDSAEFQTVLKNVTILQSEKKKLIGTVFKGFHPMIIDFLNLLLDNKRQDYLLTISKNFCVFYRKEKGIMLLKATTATKISEKIKTNLKELFIKTYSKDIELEELVDESIIGGVILRIDNEELNMSVSAQLAAIKNSLYTETYKKKV